MADLTHTAIGAWSGGRYMHFGEPLDDDRYEALLRPGPDIPTFITADVYGQGEADAALGRAVAGVRRDDVAIVGAVGHDFYEGERQGAKGFPRFTDPALRGPQDYAGYLRRATERSLERVGVDRFDLLLLHNPDRTGYTSAAVWDGMAALRDAGLADRLGIAPGPANGFTLDVITAFERFGELIDWAMVILNPMEPWPGELALDAAARHDIAVIARVVDYGGLFWDDVTSPDQLARHDHRTFRPRGWLAAGRAKLDRMRPVAERHGLTMLQLAAQWDLAHPAVRCVVPTLIQESGADARPVEDKRAELAATPRRIRLEGDEVDLLRAIGDNRGSMALKGGVPDHEGPAVADRWAVDDDLRAVAARWGIEPERELRPTAA
jgi:aryl-alcohol dehydrogenase-like predicted oxidoreductase